MNVPLPSGICPLCVFSKLCPIIGGKLMIYWDNFPGSTVPIKALMWRAKCPIKAWRCPFAHFVSSLYNIYCAPSGAKQRFTRTFSRFRRRYKGLNEGLNASLGHKDAPLSTLCLPYITVPRNGQKKGHLGTKILRKYVLFLTEEGTRFTLKMTLLLRKKGHFLGVEILGEQAPRPPDSTALDCAP